MAERYGGLSNRSGRAFGRSNVVPRIPGRNHGSPLGLEYSPFDYQPPLRPSGHAGRPRSRANENDPPRPGRSAMRMYDVPVIERLGTVPRRLPSDFERIGIAEPSVPARPPGSTGLSTLEINRSMVVNEYRSDAAGSFDSTTTCSICLEEFENGESYGKLGCLHVFHKTCLVEWLKVSSTCPKCRYNVRSERK